MTYSIFVCRKALKAPAQGKTGWLCKWVLNNIPLVLTSGEGELYQSLMKCAGNQNLRIEPKLILESTVQVHKAITSGNYCGILPSIARSELPHEQYEELPLMDDYRRRICLAWNPHLFKVRGTLETVRKAFEIAMKAKV